jgi:hypothetical protein
MSKEQHKLLDDAYENYQTEWLKENPPFARPYADKCLSQEEWVEGPDPIMDEFDKTLKMLHESTHDEKIRESILLVQRYKTEYLDI